VVSDLGYALGLAQLGGKHPQAKPWKGEGAGVFEIVESFEGNAYRGIYTVRFEGVVYVRQTKTRLAMAVNALLKERRLKQTDTATILGIPQSKVSSLANYRLDHFSVEKLISFLNALEQDVEIVIRPSREAVGHTSVFALT